MIIINTNPTAMNYILLTLAALVIYMMALNRRRYSKLKDAAYAHGMGKGISTRDWNEIRRDRALMDIYLSAVRKSNMWNEIDNVTYGKPKIWVKRDEFGIITEVRR